MERVYTWVGVNHVGDWNDPSNWRYAEYNGPGLYDGGYGTVLVNGLPAAPRAPGAGDTVAFGFYGGQISGGGTAARLVAAPDATSIVLADTTADGRTDTYSFGSIDLRDRMLDVQGAVLVSKATTLDYTSGLYVSGAGTAIDQWGRVYSADLGALTLASHPLGGSSARIVAGRNSVEVDSAVGNTAVKVGGPVFGPGHMVGGVYSDLGVGLRYDPTAAPGFYVGGALAGNVVRQGDTWVLDLGHVKLGDTLPTIVVGAANLSGPGTLTGMFEPIANDGAWAVSNTPALGGRIDLPPGSHTADYAITLNTMAVGSHTLSLRLHTSEDSAGVGHAVMPDQTFVVRATVDLPVVTLKTLSGNAAGSEGTSGVKGGGEVTFAATLDAPSLSAQTVRWHVGLVGGNTATPDDFLNGVPPSGILTFAPGETSKTISVRTAQDAIVEPDETFTVELVGPSAGLRVGGPSRIFGTILNDDAPPKPAISLVVDHPGQFEGGQGATTSYVFTAKLGAAAATQQSVRWAVSGGSLNPANDADFVGGEAPSGTLVFAAGETEKSIVVRVAGDAAAEPDETFIFSLSAATSGIDVPPRNYALATVLTDDRTAPPPSPIHVSDAQIAAYTALADRMFQHMAATHGDHFWQH